MLSFQSKLLSIRRSRLVEVSYIIRLTLNNTITLDVPLNIINFLSIDPPPSLNLSMPAANMTATDSSRIEMAVDSSVRANEDFGGKQARYSAHSEESRMEILISERSSSRASKTKSQIFYPKDRQRPESIYQEDEKTTPKQSHIAMPEPIVPFNKPRPSSMSSLPSEPATPGFRPPFSKRGSTASYYSAVASLAENEDLGVVEAHRRHGRQMSLAALTAKPMADQEDGISPEESRVATPQSATYAPSVSLTTSIEDSGHQELEEAERDLEFVRRVSGDHQQAQSVGHQSLFGRDSESPFLEGELKDDTGYRSRYTEFGSDDSHGSGVDSLPKSLHSNGHIHPSESVSGAVEDDINLADPSRNSADKLEVPQADGADPECEPAYTTETLEQHHDSTATSAMSGVDGAETEIGQVVQAIRRDLSIRQAPLNGKEALQLRLRQARSPGPSIGREPSRTAFGQRSSASGAEGRKDVFLSSPINSPLRARSTAVKTIYEQDDPANSAVQTSIKKLSGATTTSSAVETSNPIEGQTPESGLSTSKPLRITTPVEGISESPGLTPSIAEESASSHDGSRASTPGQEGDTDDDGDLQVVNEIPESTSPTDHALEQLMLEADETMASLGLDSLSRKNVGLKYPLNKDLYSTNRFRDNPTAPRSPAGPRQRNSFTSSAPGSPLSQYSQSLDHGQEMHRSPEPERAPLMMEQTTPTRRSHTAILGGARNRYSNRTSGTSHTTDYMTHSPGSSVNSQHMIMTPGRHYPREFEGQYHLEDIPEIRTTASNPSFGRKEADQSSITSMSTSATMMGTMLLERKSSSHVFPYSKQMTGYTSQQLRPKNSLSDEYDQNNYDGMDEFV